MFSQIKISCSFIEGTGAHVPVRSHIEGFLDSDRNGLFPCTKFQSPPLSEKSNGCSKNSDI